MGYLPDKRLLLSYSFLNLELKDHKIRAEYTPAFQFLQEWTPKLNNIFELENSTIYKSKTGIMSPVHVGLLAWLDKFRTFNWQKALPVPDLALFEINKLCSLI